MFVDDYYPPFTTFICKCKLEVPYTHKDAYVVEHIEIPGGNRLCCSKSCAVSFWKWNEFLRCRKGKDVKIPVEGKDIYPNY